MVHFFTAVSNNAVITRLAFSPVNLNLDIVIMVEGHSEAIEIRRLLVQIIPAYLMLSLSRQAPSLIDTLAVASTAAFGHKMNIHISGQHSGIENRHSDLSQFTHAWLSRATHNQLRHNSWDRR